MNHDYPPRGPFLLSCLALALACGLGSDTAAPEAIGAAPADVPAPLDPPVFDLGPADPELEPLHEPEAVEYELPNELRRILRGRAGTGRKLPESLGRSGNLLVAIDTPFQLFARDSTYVHVAAWRTDGRPASNASVFVGGKEIGRTDSTGTLVFRHRADDEHDDEHDDDTIIVVDANGRCGAVDFNPFARTPSFASDNLFVYTDRGVYRPGEIVRVRGIGWRLTDEYAPLRAAPIELQLRDAGGRTVAGGIPSTDEFGVFEIEFPLAATAGEGLYELRVAYGQERAMGRLQVRDFEIPTITIEHTLGRFLARDADKLEFQLSLALVTGEPVTDATLRLSATARDQTVLFQRELALAGAGPHSIALLDDELAKLLAATPEDEFVTLRLEVGDADGRRDELRRELRVTTMPYVGVLELDKDQYATGDPVKLAIRLSDRDQVPTRATPVRVKIASTSGEQVLTTTTDGKGTASLEFAMPGQGGEITLFVGDLERPVATTSLPWVAIRAMRSELAQLVIAERETARLVVRFPSGYRPADKWVHVDVVDTSGALVNATLLAVSQEHGQWIARGEFTAPTWGSMLLTLFALGQVDGGQVGPGEYGLLTEGQNLVVHPDKELEITLQGFPEQARPGDPLEVRALVVDARGAPVDAAVGVSLVDAALIDLKDPLEITPMDRFYNPQLRTLSTTGSKILTWPVVSRNWGSNRMDIALPPFNYLEGGSVVGCSRIDQSVGGYGYGYGYGKGKGGDSGGASAGLVGGVTGKKPDKLKADEQYDSSIDALLDPTKVESSSSTSGSAPPSEPEPEAANPASPRPAPPQAAKATITIRTQLPDIALWSPNERVKQGVLDVRTRLPETIGEQELIVVASDARGGVGVRRERVRVSQPVHVGLDLPARLIAGEQVELPVIVTNSTSDALDFVASLRAPGIDRSAPVRVEAKGRRGVALPLSAADPGVIEVRARAAGGSYDDTLVQRVDVDGRGVPIPHRQHGVLSSTPLTFELDLATSANDAALRVRFPTITSAFSALDQLDQALLNDPDAVAVDLTTAALILQWADARQLSSPALAVLRERALSGVALLRLIQAKDGSFSYWRNGVPSPFVTGWALEGMLEARAAGLPYANTTVTRAAEFIASSIAPADNLVSVTDIGWWEGSTHAVRLGLTAELYAVMARIPTQDQSTIVRTKLEALDAKFLAELDRGTLDSLAAARAIQGLVRRGKLTPERTRELLRALMAKRDGAHWEPSWFHAYGGRLEASAVLVEVISELDPVTFAVELRDALAWVLSTRESWGIWHNERSTSAALRAIAHARPAPEEVPATVEVWLDGHKLRRVTIDPADPFTSALPLASLELGENLPPGKHRLELRYDGKLAPSVEVETRSWQAGTQAMASSKAGGSKRKLAVKAAQRVGIGTSTNLRVEFFGPKRAAGGTLVVAASNLLELDLVKLGAWVGPGRPLRSARLIDGRVELELSPTVDQVAFDLPFIAIRRGVGHAPAVAWLPGSGQPGAEAIVVDPGPLEVH